MSLRVEPNVPCGNVCDVSVSEQGERAEVAFAAHPHGGPESLWFRFRVCGGAPNGIRLVLRHARTMLGADRPEALRPVVRSDGRDWCRLQPGTGEQFPDGRTDISWMVGAFYSDLDVAFCYPYGRDEVEALRRETGACWRADVIGVSQGGRPMVRLSNSYGAADAHRPGLFIVARQHSGETPGSWVLDGFLRAIAELEDRAPLVWAVPLANIDGVEGGDYGKDNFPYDLNRAWGRPPMRHETLVIGTDVAVWKTRCRPVLVLDLHAPGACEREGMYAYVLRPDAWPELHGQALTWAERLKASLGPAYAAENFVRTADYPSRWMSPTFVEFAAKEHGICGLSIETPYALIGERELSREDYREAGARIAAGILCAL